RLAVARGDRADVSLRKHERRVGAEAHGFAARIDVAAHALALRAQLVQQAHGLEELERARALEQLLFQRSCISPARGGHRFNSPGRWRTRATVCVNELTEV